MNTSVPLRAVAATVLVLNTVATVVAVVVNWPAQFGGVGTNAADEFLTRGTAISAPLLPVVLLLLVLVLAGRGGVAGWVGVGAAFVCAVTVGIGGLGELMAEPTQDTPRPVLVGAGVVWLCLAVLLAATAARAAVGRRSRGRDVSAEASSGSAPAG